MKKILPALALLLVTFRLVAQETPKAPAAKTIIRTAADLKTGNSQDLLVSFFQLALNDLTGKEKTFRFQSSLFALKAKTDPTLFVDTNFLKHTASRNFVFSIAPALDSSFKFLSNTVGVKYALVNNRDKAVFDFALPSEQEWNRVQTAALKEYAAQLPDGIRNPKYKLANNFFLDEEEVDGEKRTPLSELPDDFQKILQTRINNSVALRNNSLTDFRDILFGEYKTLSRYVENRGLWTIEGNAAHDKNAVFSRVIFVSEYLKGMLQKNTKMNLELNLRATLNLNDDTLSKGATDLRRQVFAFSGGFNWVIAKNRKNQSIIELKGLLTYNNVLSGGYPGEKRSQLSGEGVFRVRITDQLWIPIDVKYDPQRGNVFGFLSIRSNFDWLKNSNQ